MSRNLLMQVKNAYAKIKMKPCRRNYFRQEACCPLAALYLAAGGVEHTTEAVEEWAEEQYATSRGDDWWEGFVMGVEHGDSKIEFDIRDAHRKDFCRGFAEGHRIAKALGLTNE